VILCSLTPISDYVPNRPQSRSRPPADILKLNAWIKTYAAQVGAGFADYYTATVDEKGMLKEGYSNDGLHPNEKGYALMVPVAAAAIEQALR
jgi:lysophospholipase L1-like esterase